MYAIPLPACLPASIYYCTRRDAETFTIENEGQLVHIPSLVTLLVQVF